MKKNALNILKNFVTTTIVELDTQFVMTISVFYYYDDDELFDVNKDIDILRQFLKKCKFDINGWNTTAEIGINNSTETNYSDIIFNREFKFLTRLDIKNLRF